MNAILLAAAAAFGATLVVCLVLLHRMQKAAERADAERTWLYDQRHEDGELIAEMNRQAGYAQVETSHLYNRIRDLSAQLDKAIKDGGLAAKASMKFIARLSAGKQALRIEKKRLARKCTQLAAENARLAADNERLASAQERSGLALVRGKNGRFTKADEVAS